MKKIAILGATGSIGRNAVDVVLSHPGELQAVALSALSSREECEALARKLGAKAYVGEDSAIRAVEESDADLCRVATVGASGLKPTLAAIRRGMDIALATKEVLVMAGELVTAEARRRGLYTIGFAGYDGGAFAAEGTVDACFVVRSQSVHRIQESQALLGHRLWAAVQRHLAARHNGGGPR